MRNIQKRLLLILVRNKRRIQLQHSKVIGVEATIRVLEFFI